MIFSHMPDLKKITSYTLFLKKRLGNVLPPNREETKKAAIQ